MPTDVTRITRVHANGRRFVIERHVYPEGGRQVFVWSDLGPYTIHTFRTFR